jgi:predicted RNase H-like nuclease (RuvC/YqgF family)
LKAAVRRSLGQQIDQVGAADLGARVEELTAANQRLEGELVQEKARAEELQGRLTETQDDLAGARKSLRRMIRSGNQEPAV